MLQHFFLQLSHNLFLFAAFSIIAIWYKRDFIFEAFILALFAVIFNYSLKVTFQIPLMPHLGSEGFAFPSGHMQSATCFYGWLFYRFNNPILRFMLAATIVGVGYYTYAANYHLPYEIIAGFIVGTFTIFCYALNISKTPSPKVNNYLLKLSAACNLYSFLYYGKLSNFVLSCSIIIIGAMFVLEAGKTKWVWPLANKLLASGMIISLYMAIYFMKPDFTTASIILAIALPLIIAISPRIFIRNKKLVAQQLN